MNLAYFAPTGQTFAAIAGVAFFVVLALTAYIAFKALRKTMKMAMRLVIVMVILAVAVVGSISLWYFSSDGVQKQRPPANRVR